MHVELFIAGWLTAPAGVIRAGADMHEPFRFPVPAYVIETGTERILLDTGPHPSAMADPDGFYGRPGALGPFSGEQEDCIADLLDVDTITRVVLTHLHYDHAGGLPLIPARVPVVLQRAEWAAGHDDAAITRNHFLPRDYAGTDRPVELVDGEHDLLGDGSVILLPTPGHTPGHQSVRMGDLVIGGDVTHLATGLDDLRLPVFGDDLEAQARSAERLRALRDSGRTVLPGHDPAVLRAGPVRV